jgi:hypothetical protein
MIDQACAISKFCDLAQKHNMRNSANHRHSPILTAKQHNSITKNIFPRLCLFKMYKRKDNGFSSVFSGRLYQEHVINQQSRHRNHKNSLSRTSIGKPTSTLYIMIFANKKNSSRQSKNLLTLICHNHNKPFFQSYEKAVFGLFHGQLP